MCQSYHGRLEGALYALNISKDQCMKEMAHQQDGMNSHAYTLLVVL